MTPMQALTASIKAGDRPTAADTMAMLYELASASNNHWPEFEWMSTGPEDWADVICAAQQCMEKPRPGAFDVLRFPSIWRQS